MKLHKETNLKKSEDPEHSFYEAVAAIKTAAEAQMFFQDLCTPTELQAMADRWLVVAPIKKGAPYRRIYEETGVSVTTIGRVARCITLGTGGYDVIFERLEKKKNASRQKTSSRGTKKRST